MLKLESERLILRKLCDDDLKDFHYYRSNPAVARFQTWYPFSLKDSVEFISKYGNSKPSAAGEWCQLGIVLKSNNKLIGDCGVKTNSSDARLAEICCTLSVDYQRQGLAKESITLLFDYAFDELDIHRITAITDCKNLPSIRLFERLEMRREGHFIKNLWFKGRWCNEYLYAILEEEWIRKRLIQNYGTKNLNNEN